MNARTELQLMRLLHGELPPGEARALEQRIAAQPELAAAYRRLAGLWEGLELPPPRPVPPGFATRVVSRARDEGRAPSLAGAPAWVRLAGALSLAAGLAVGAGLGLWQEVGRLGDVDGEGEVSLEEGSSLAEAYWSALEGEAGSRGTASDEAGAGEAGEGIPR